LSSGLPDAVWEKSWSSQKSASATFWITCGGTATTGQVPSGSWASNCRH